MSTPPPRPVAPARHTLWAAFASPACIAHLPRSAWRWLGIYVVAAATILAIVAAVLEAHREDLFELALGYVLPESWQWAGRWLVERFFAEQQRLILVNMIATAASLLVTMVLFPVKEHVSLVYERDARLIGDPIDELPLWLQGWQEVKLFLFFLAMQGSLLWMGYFPGRGLHLAAAALSFLFLCATFAIDFASPLLQRHRGYYSQILKTLARNPLPTLLFGAIFAAPTLLASALWAAHPEWPFAASVTMLFFATVLSTAWAQVAGTRFAVALYPDFQRTRRSRRATGVLAWLLLGAVLAANAWSYGAVGLAVHHKSQIFKCDYAIVPSTFELSLPGLGGLLLGRVEVGASVEVEIHNPTEFDLRLEDNRLEIDHRGTQVATSRLVPVDVPAGATVRQRVGLALAIDPTLVTHGLDLFRGGEWSVTLYIEVTDGFDLPVYLLRSEAQN